jgi:hypothetical protein
MPQYNTAAFLFDAVSLLKDDDMAEMTITRRIGFMAQSLVVACGVCLQPQAIAQTKDYGPGSGDFISPKKVEDRSSLGNVSSNFRKTRPKNIVLHGREETAPADALKPANQQ